MSLVAEMGARERGNEICRVLLLRGYKPLWIKTEADGHRLIACFQIMSGWRKAVVLTDEDTPDTAEAALKDWKAGLRNAWARGEPPEIVREAIAAWGETMVRAALA